MKARPLSYGPGAWVVSIALLVGAFAIYYGGLAQALDWAKLNSGWSQLALLGIGLPSIWGLAWIVKSALVRLAARLLRPRFVPDRGPGTGLVLYLRSFSTDHEWAASSEAHLVHLVHGIGSLVAVGRPGERLPPYGAARCYFTDEHWQAGVADLVGSSALVVVHLSSASAGLAWEVEHVVRNIQPNRLLVILGVPDDLPGGDPSQRENAYSRIYEDYSHHFPQGLPKSCGDAHCIVFDADWTPQTVGPRDRPIRSNVFELSLPSNFWFHYEYEPDSNGPYPNALISYLGALEELSPSYRLPTERQLPADLRLNRLAELLFGAYGSLATFFSLFPEVGAGTLAIALMRVLSRYPRAKAHAAEHPLPPRRSMLREQAGVEVVAG
jgi:hypothetical protein